MGPLCALFSDGRRLLTGDHDGLLQIWDLATRKEINRINVGPWIIDSLILRSNDKQVLVAGVDGLRLIDLETGQKIRKFQAEHEEVYHASLSPDGRLLTASFDGVVRLWDFESGEVLRTGQAPRFRVLGSLLARRPNRRGRRWRRTPRWQVANRYRPQYPPLGSGRTTHHCKVKRSALLK